MALTLGNPIVVTGSMATSYKTQLAAAVPNAGIYGIAGKGAGVITGSYGTLTALKIAKIEWLSPVTVGDQVNIGDPNSGLTLLNLVCEVALQSQIIDWTASPVLWNDFEIDRMNSGTLYLWTEG
jgi:hypothetical protein